MRKILFALLLMPFAAEIAHADKSGAKNGYYTVHSRAKVKYTRDEAPSCGKIHEIKPKDGYVFKYKLRSDRKLWSVADEKFIPRTCELSDKGVCGPSDKDVPYDGVGGTVASDIWFRCADVQCVWTSITYTIVSEKTADDDFYGLVDLEYRIMDCDASGCHTRCVDVVEDKGMDVYDPL